MVAAKVKGERDSEGVPNAVFFTVVLAFREI